MVSERKLRKKWPKYRSSLKEVLEECRVNLSTFFCWILIISNINICLYKPSCRLLATHPKSNLGFCLLLWTAPSHVVYSVPLAGVASMIGNKVFRKRFTRPLDVHPPRHPRQLMMSNAPTMIFQTKAQYHVLFLMCSWTSWTLDTYSHYFKYLICSCFTI